jgi:glycosyltransferase involved in cell wall biosynthesis
MRLHLLGIPHTITRAEFSHDAFTNKVRSFAPCVRQAGYEVVHYGVAGAESGATEQVDLLSEDEWVALMGGRPDPHARGWFWHEKARVDTPVYERFNRELTKALVDRVAQDDIVCATFGRAHQMPLAVMSAMGRTVVESGIGYPGSYLPYRVFESYAWMHYTLGREDRHGSDYWWVVPNPFDVREWPDTAQAGDYLLFMGRLTDTKGLNLVKAVAETLPHLEIKVAGQGNGDAWQAPNITHVGPVAGAERAHLYGGALATLCLSRYVEPFAQVHVESLLCGTPVLASDWGAFVEHVHDGINGFRCRTLGDLMAGIERCRTMDRPKIAAMARAKFGLDVVARQYDQVFQQLHDLRGMGWYTRCSHRF